MHMIKKTHSVKSLSDTRDSERERRGGERLTLQMNRREREKGGGGVDVETTNLP